MAEAVSMPYIILSRHGETPTNAAAKTDRTQKIIVGPENEPLSDKGEEQAREAGKTISKMAQEFGFNVLAAISSDFPRAITTRELILQALPNQANIRREVEEKFRERNAGVFMNRKESELRQEFPDYFDGGTYANWPAHFDYGAPEGENYQDLQNRVLPAMQARITESNLKESDALHIVTHMHPTRVMLGELLLLHPERITQLPIGNATPYLLRMKDKNALLGEGSDMHEFLRKHS